VIDWDETGGPSAHIPSKLGFGLTIVRSSIEEQFRGGVIYDWRPRGLHCTLSIPRAQVVDLPQLAGIEAPAAVPEGGPAVDALAGKRIMVVEDELLISMMVKQMLSDLGAVVVGPYNSLSKGLMAVQSESMDGAVLDFNLAGEPADPLANVLAARSVPFLFITGYERDSIDRRYANVPVLQKPIEADSLQRVLVSLLGSLKSTIAA
jgi:CheY-like chemotaxis protein